MALLLSLPAAAQTSRPAIRDTVVPQTFLYATRGTDSLLLDVYRPHQPRQDSACILYMFGGGFVSGARNNEGTRAVCQHYVAEGYTVVAIDYRLHLKRVDYDTVRLFNMQSIFRRAISIAASDCAAAIAYLWPRADALGIARNRIALVGSSAGAISVLQLDYCRANRDQQGSLFAAAAELPEGFKPAAVVAFSGAIYADHGRPRYATAPAPTFLLHGVKDRIVHYKKFPPLLREGLYGPKKIQRTFNKENRPYWFFRYPEVGHEVSAMPIVLLPECCAFIDAALAGRVSRYEAECHDDQIQPTKWSRMNVFDLYSGK